MMNQGVTLCHSLIFCRFCTCRADTFRYLFVEKPLYFDPFGQIEFAPVGHNIIAPCKVLVQGSILFYPFRDFGFS